MVFQGELSAKDINISWPSRGHCILCFSLLFFHLSPSGIFLYFLHQTLHNEFSCLLLPRLLSFPLSHGVSSSLLYQPFIMFRAPQIMLPSLYLLNDHKMHLCAQHLRGSHCRRLLYSLILCELSLKAKLPHIYHCTFQSKAQCCSMPRLHRFETGAIGNDKAFGDPRGFP